MASKTELNLDDFDFGFSIVDEKELEAVTKVESKLKSHNNGNNPVLNVKDPAPTSTLENQVDKKTNDKESATSPKANSLSYQTNNDKYENVTEILIT